MRDQIHFNIFYSWQSDIYERANYYFIKDSIDKAIKELNKEKEVTVIPRLEKDTQGLSGSPNIVDAILSKIDASNIFIADVTIVNNNWFNKYILKKRLTPNPNVLFETGYALNRLSWDRIICLNNKAFSIIEDMPFDLKQNRISQYTFDGKANKDAAKKELTQLLKNAIKTIIDNYPALISKHLRQDKHQHDIQVFETLEKISDEHYLIRLLDSVGNIYIINHEDLFMLKNIVSYLGAPKNQFLIPEIKISAENFLNSLNSMLTVLAKNLTSRFEKYFDEVEQIDKQVISYCLVNDPIGFKSYEQFEQIREKKINEIQNVVDKTIESYKLFRSTVKNELFI